MSFLTDAADHRDRRLEERQQTDLAAPAGHVDRHVERILGAAHQLHSPHQPLRSSLSREQRRPRSSH